MSFVLERGKRKKVGVYVFRGRELVFFGGVVCFDFIEMTTAAFKTIFTFFSCSCQLFLFRFLLFMKCYFSLRIVSKK